MFMNFKSGRAAAMAFAGFLAAAASQPAWAGQTTLEFKDRTAGENSLTISGFEIMGGRVVDSADYGKVYADDGGVLIRAADNSKITSITVTVINPNPNSVKEFQWILDNIRYTNNNRPNDWEVGKKSSREIKTPISDFKKAVFSRRFGNGDFYISKIVINTGPPATVLSVRAFIPGDNAPAAPDVSCVALPEAAANGVNNAPTVVRGVTASPTSAEKRGLFVGGDGDGSESERAFHAVSVVPDRSVDSDGLAENTEARSVEEERAFEENALSNGVIIGPAWDDRNGGDCYWFHQSHMPSANSMKVDVTRVDDTTVSAHFIGSVKTLLGGRSGKGAIDWDLTVTLDADGNYSVTGAHDGFPAYEVAIGNTIVYESSPGNGPYTFAKHTRKLRGGMDVQVNE